MTRIELGLRLQQWHSSMHDPIYAVGSFYFDDRRYPDIEIVKDALFNLERELDKSKRMLAVNLKHGRYASEDPEDMKRCPGFPDKTLKDNIGDLEEIVSELKRFMQEDY